MSAAQKTALRTLTLARRDALEPEIRARYSAAITAHCLAIAGEFPAGPISLFWPIRSEIDTLPLMQALKQRGHALALPRVEGSSLEFRLWQDDQPLIKGKFSLSEPSIAAPLTRPRTMLIPLAAYDKAGQRIGYGKGFYDRAIAALNPARKIGLAFSCQQVDHVPVEPHDERLDLIITEQGLLQPRV